MNIGTIIIVLSAVLFIAGVLLTIAFDSCLADDGVEHIVQASKQEFRKFCIGMDIGIILTIIAVILLPIGVVVAVLL